MTKNKGVAILLFAILLQLCSSGMELLTLGVGALGLVLAIIEDRKLKQICGLSNIQGNEGQIADGN